jgi:hypothetical protein
VRIDVRAASNSRLATAWRLVVAFVVAIVGLAGCASAPASPGLPASDVASTAATPSPILTSSPSTSPSAVPSPSLAAATGALTFVATGSMHAAREFATATLLKNGKVLIAGGEGDAQGLLSTHLASAELYDPATGKFSTTGSMTAARADATATLLPDGRVLIAGGEGCSNPKRCTDVPNDSIEHLASAELYDPTTGKFSKTGSMSSPDGGLAPTLMPDGRVLLLGLDPELYDPATGKFVGTGKEDVERPTATLLPDGKVLVAGDSGTGSTVGELYDEASGKFNTVPLALPPGTSSVQFRGQTVIRQVPSAATLLKNGRVLLFEGGYLETYDPASATCADAGFVSPYGEWDKPTVTLLSDGRVLISGGSLVMGVSSNEAAVYDPNGGPINRGSMLSARKVQTATLLSDGSVLIAGGQDANYMALASAELFKP